MYSAGCAQASIKVGPLLRLRLGDMYGLYGVIEEGRVPVGEKTDFRH
jgi:hypothetical protein